jgi:predicted outer membrane repeat protein
MDSGGIYIYGANFTLRNSTVKNNHAARGAGIFTINNASLTILNSTISSNAATTSGAGIYAVDGTITINNSTIAYNASSGMGGGITRESGTISIKNSILARNTATTNGADCSGSIASSDHNIIGTTMGCTVTSGAGDKFNVNPVISSSLSGTLPLHTLQPESPAINAGDNSTCLSTDQRGVSRPRGSACDMGAYEFGAEAGLFVASGSDQTASPGTSFTLPLSVYLLDGSGSPVLGTTITFTAPSSGASGTFASSGTRIATAVTNSSGYATSAVFTANNQLGEYTITAAGGGFSTTFTLRNSAADYYVSPTGSDSNPCTLPASACRTINAAINKAIDGDTIYIAAGVYTHTDALNHVVFINGKSLSLYGGWNPGFTAQTGFTIVDGEKQYGGFSIWGNSGKTITVDHFHIRNGDDGGIYLSSPNLIITNSSIYNNTRIGYTLNGGGIYIHSGTLTARNVTFNNNITSGQGGAIYAYGGSYTLNNVTITNNTASSGGGLVGNNAGATITRVVKNSILFGNQANAGPDCVAEFTGMDHTCRKYCRLYRSSG